MDGVGDEFLAGAVLTLDEHVGVARRHGFDEVEELAHHLALADHRAEAVGVAQLGPQFLVAQPFVDLPARPLENTDQPGRIELRLLDEVERPGLSGIQRARDGALSRDDDDLAARRAFLHALEHVEAVAVGQQQVEQHQFRPPLVEQNEAGAAQPGRPHVEGRIRRGLLDHHLEPVHRGRVVVDYQHTAPARLRAGHRTIIPHPPPGGGRTDWL